MLQKIAVVDLRLGMHLHELCGTWLDHPFWRCKFVLADAADLAKLHASGVKDCWIDDSRGLGLPPPAPVPTPKPVLPVAEAPRIRPEPATPKPATQVPMSEELGRAVLLIKESRKAVTAMFAEARMGRMSNSEQTNEMVAEIAASVWRNPEAIVSLVRLKTHDDYTYMHSVAVCAMMVSLSRQLGHDEAQARQAGKAGLLHDMGKALMPLELLNKPGKLTAAEYTLMKHHPQRGHELLLQANAPAMALDVCLHHHERVDGKGYPFGLSGAALTLAARMGAVCDVYDAITSNRPYKAGWDPAESIALMADWTKKGQFDPAVFRAFVTGLGIYPTGSLVRLKSGRLAVVVEQNPAGLAAPKVKVFFSTRSQMPVPLEVIDLCRPGCTEQITARESNSTWQFKHLDELWAGPDALKKSNANG
jgi:HD-GYP domain-containing protein (c-di-GMP phosphodiesterase class II)